MLKILFNSLINEGSSKMLQPAQRRIQIKIHTYRQIKNAEMDLQIQAKLAGIYTAIIHCNV